MEKGEVRGADGNRRSVWAFWDQLRPAIECEGVEFFPTDRITLADFEAHQRFDADWVSFEDENAVTPVEADFRA